MISAGLGLILQRLAQRRWPLPWSLGAGVGIDVDHFVDAAINVGRERPLMLVPFHGWDVQAVAFLLLWRWLGLRLAALLMAPLALHLVCDTFANPVRPGGYFFFVRLWHRFDAHALLRHQDAAIQAHRYRDIIPVLVLGGLFGRKATDGWQLTASAGWRWPDAGRPAGPGRALPSRRPAGWGGGPLQSAALAGIMRIAHASPGVAAP